MAQHLHNPRAVSRGGVPMNSKTVDKSRRGSNSVSFLSIDSVEQLGRENEIASNFFGWENLPESGEARLMRAVLRDAIRCFQKYSASRRISERGRRELQAARQWFAQDDEDHALSFVNICSMLGLDARVIRSALATWQSRQAKRRRNAKPLQCRNDVIQGRPTVVAASSGTGRRTSKLTRRVTSDA